jgi:hypothetical protein
MIPVETMPGIRGGGGKESGRGMNSSIIYLIHCKNFCKCHNVSPLSTTIKGEKRKISNTHTHTHK